MSNLSAKIVRSIVADYFKIENESQIRISGYVKSLTTSKNWYGYYSDGFQKLEAGLSTVGLHFLVSVEQTENEIKYTVFGLQKRHLR